MPLNGPMEEAAATMRALGDDLPEHHRELEGRGAGMIATFTRGKGEVFTAVPPNGPAPWSCAIPSCPGSFAMYWSDSQLEIREATGSQTTRRAGAAPRGVHRGLP